MGVLNMNVTNQEMDIINKLVRYLINANNNWENRELDRKLKLKEKLTELEKGILIRIITNLIRINNNLENRQLLMKVKSL